ncbi:hypothetical protein [Macromonas bipunctata]|uniref:hypothetical protein n=1 Tax=Macromonas bipunctata TaxID=183670 RepID=UPI0011AEEF93|nr:hypothetical protein [Macromonas bipunctata]
MTLVEHVLYPSLIHRACSLLDEWDFLKKQPDGFFRVILRIVKKINLKRPHAAVFAKRATLAIESGQSVQTVNRAIRWLEAEGFITRTKKAHPGLRGSSSPLVPTPKFLTLLMLDPVSIKQSYAEAEAYVLGKYALDNGCLPPEVASKKKNRSRTACTTEQEEDGAGIELDAQDLVDSLESAGISQSPDDLEISSVLAAEDEAVATVQQPQPAATEAAAETTTPVAAVEVRESMDTVVDTPAIPALANKYEAAIKQYKAETAQRAAERDHRRGFVQFGHVKIPADLTWLVENLGMRATGVLQLMGLAKQANQTLSEVVSAVKKYLTDLDGREAYAYLRKLLGLGKDFGYKVRETNQQQDAKDERAYLELKAEALAGRSFFSPKSQAQYTIQPSGLVEVLQNGKHSAMRLCRKFLDAIDTGKLRAVRA